MRKEAEANKEADDKRKALAEAKNEADAAIFQTEKSLKDLVYYFMRCLQVQCLLEVKQQLK